MAAGLTYSVSGKTEGNHMFVEQIGVEKRALEGARNLMSQSYRRSTRALNRPGLMVGNSYTATQDYNQLATRKDT